MDNKDKVKYLDQLMGDLFQSSSREKGIEKVIDGIGNLYTPNYIGVFEYDQKERNLISVYEWLGNTNGFHLPDTGELLELWEQEYHFNEADFFYQADLSKLSIHEKEVYERYHIQGMFECELRKQGDCKGYLLCYWSSSQNQLLTEDWQCIHIAAQMVGEALSSNMEVRRKLENEATAMCVLEGMQNTAIYVIDEQYRILYANAALKKNVPDAKIGGTCYQCMMKRDSPCEQCIKGNINETSSSGIIMYNPIDDKQLHMYMSKINMNEESVYVVSCSDYLGTALEQEKERSVHRLAAVLQKIYYQVLQVNLSQDTYIDISQGEFMEEGAHCFSREFVYRQERYVHEDDKKAFLKFMETEEIERAFMRGEKNTSLEFRYCFTESTYEWARVSIVFIDGLPGRDLVCFICFQDIDKEKKLEMMQERELNAALVRARSNQEAQRSVLASISHEIRTPMNGIIGMTNLARRVIDDKEKAIDCLHNIDISSRYLISVLNDILDISKIEDGDMELNQEYFDLETMLENLDIMLRPKADAKRITFTIENTCSNQVFLGDKYRLNQVLVNLVSNGFKFTPDGGSVKLMVAEEETREEKTFLHFVVKDTGIGINFKNQERIFRPFTRNEKGYSGTGLGLSISQNIIHLMGGKIQVQSQEGKGAEFYFTIPLVLGDETMLYDENLEDQMDFKGKRVLLVEDNDLNAQAMKAILETVGFQVETAEDGKQGVIRFVTKPAQYYDIILMDIQMPVLDGHEAAKCIRISGKGDAKTIPVVALTANAQGEEAEKTKQAGMNGYLIKPIELDQLYQLMEQLLNKE